MRRIMILVAAVAFLAGCDDSTGPNGAAQVQVQFAATSAAAAAPAAGSARLVSLGLGDAAPAALTLPGTNGTLELETVHVIVNEFELEREDDDACDDDFGDGSLDDDCEEFEAGPSFVELGLEGGAATAASAPVPPGRYDELEFEIEDLEDDEEDDDAGRIAALLTEIRDQYPDWPREASMRVTGTFTEDGGEAQSFVAYFEAEIEVELEFDTPLVITEDDASRTITVQLDPARWFVRGDGSVLNLAQYDFESTGQVLEFEFEMENGFEGVDHDDDDGDDD